MKRTKLLGALVVVAVAFALAPSGASAGAGPLTPVGCISDDGAPEPGCGPARAMRNAAYLAVSPDGRHVYVSSRDSDAIAVFARDRTTGGLAQLPGEAGCVADSAAPLPGCGVAGGLDRPGGIAISADGRDLYVTGLDSDSLVSFRRDPASGAISSTGCLSGPGPGQDPDCAPAAGLGAPIGVALSPDGAHLYVASTATDAIAYFARDPASGAPAHLGCVSNTPVTGCATTAPGLNGANWVAVSPDGQNIYVSSPDASAVAAFARDPGSGALTSLGCISGNDGRRQDPGCAGGHEMEYMQHVAVSPDGAHVYASATDTHALIIFARDPGSGALTQVGCLSDFTDSAGECESASGLSLPLGIAITPDGRNVYTGAFGYGSVASFERDPATGLLVQYRDCFSGEDVVCEVQPGLSRGGYLAISPDNRHVYVNAPTSNAVSIFARSSSSTAPEILTSKTKVRRKRLPFSLACPADADGGCLGTLDVSLAGNEREKVRFNTAPYDLLAGEQGGVDVSVRRRDARELGDLGRFKVLVVAAGLQPGDLGASSSRVVRVRP
jgi:DNA-binding beta-propeller fold protein YncE